jgi:hypothetical protein
LRYFLSLSIFFIFVSCASNQAAPTISDDLNVVSLDKESKRGSTPIINNDEHNLISVGPQSSSINSSNTPKKKVWGLYLGPGINRTIGHAVAVRAIHEKGIQFNMISGTGLGAVVAAYLAMGLTPEVIEWKFHKFFLKIKDKRPFSREWLTQVNKSLLADFENLQIQSTKLTLIIPVYNYNDKKIEYARRGNLKEKILENLQLEKTKGNNISVLTNGSISFQKFRELGMQVIISIDALSGKVNFLKKEDFLIGIFGKLSAARSTSLADFNFELPSSNFSLDSINELPEYLRATYLSMETDSKDLAKEFQKKSGE